MLRRRAETKRKGLEQAKFKETLAERQETLEEKKYKKLVEENVRSYFYTHSHILDILVKYSKCWIIDLERVKY